MTYDRIAAMNRARDRKHNRVAGPTNGLSPIGRYPHSGPGTG